MKYQKPSLGYLGDASAVIESMPPAQKLSGVNDPQHQRPNTIPAYDLDE